MSHKYSRPDEERDFHDELSENEWVRVVRHASGRGVIYYRQVDEHGMLKQDGSVHLSGVDMERLRRHVQFPGGEAPADAEISGADYQARLGLAARSAAADRDWTKLNEIARCAERFQDIVGLYQSTRAEAQALLGEGSDDGEKND